MSTSTERKTVNDGNGRWSVASWLPQLHPRQSLDDLVNPVFWRDVVVEFVVCIFIGCYIIWVLTTLREDLYQLSTTHIGLFAGFFIIAVVEGYGPVSGAFVNPASCWGFFLVGRISAARSK